MNLLNRILPVCLLGALATAVRAADDPIRLVVDQSTQTLRIEAGMPGAVFLVLGPLAVPPIPLGDITLDVVPHHVLSLGAFETGNIMQLFVPRNLSGFSAEAVLFDPRKGTLHDSNVVGLEIAFRDMIDATFRAVLVSTDSIPPYYTVGATLTAPTTGFDLVADSIQLEENVMHVYLRLITPTDIVIPVVCDHRVAVDLGTDVGNEVHVHMMRAPRGLPGPEVYKRMAILPVGGEGK
jgi:hypothetical protein